MPAELMDNPNRLAERVVGIDDGLTIEEMLERADEIVDRTVCQWHAGAVHEVMFMISRWAGRGMSAVNLATTAMCFAAVARDMKESATELGYPDIAAAAGDVTDALLRIDAGVENGDDGRPGSRDATVATALIHLRTRIAEARRVGADGADLLAAAA